MVHLRIAIVRASTTESLSITGGLYPAVDLGSDGSKIKVPNLTEFGIRLLLEQIGDLQCQADLGVKIHLLPRRLITGHPQSSPVASIQNRADSRRRSRMQSH